MSYQVVLTIAPDADPITVSDSQYADLLAQGLIESATPGGVDSDPGSPAWLVGPGNVNFDGAIEISDGLTVGAGMTVAERLTVAGFDLPSTKKTFKAITKQKATQGFYFQASHGWTAGGTGTASSADDTAVSAIGSQSLRVTTTGDGNQSYVRKTGLTAIDMTGKAFRITFRVTDVTKFDRVQLAIASDSAFVNNYIFAFYADNAQANSYVQSGEWVEWVIPWSAVSSRAGTYTLTNGVPTTEAMRTGFTALSLAFYDKAAGAMTYHVNAIEVVPDSSERFPNGVISITFDDSWKEQSTVARAKMDQLGFRGTAYTIADLIGNNVSYMTLAELKSLRRTSNWEVAGHAYSNANHGLPNGFSSATAAQVDLDFFKLKSWMEQYGFDSDNFAYPKGHFENTTDNVPVHEIAQRYWRTSRTIAGGSYESLVPSHPQKVKAITGITDQSGLGGRLTSSLTASGGEMDRIYNNGSWSIWCFHKLVSGTPAASTEISNTGFADLMDAIAAKGISVLPVNEVIDYYR